MQVSEVKGAMRDELIASGAAIRYSEPEKLVMSRSGDECVVALTDQWYLTYGEDEWLAATRQACCSNASCGCHWLVLIIACSLRSQGTFCITCGLCIAPYGSLYRRAKNGTCAAHVTRFTASP